MKRFLASLIISTAIVSNVIPINFNLKNSATHQSLKEICKVNYNAEQVMDLSKTNNLVNFVQRNLELDDSFESIIKQCAMYLNQKSYDFLLNKKEKLELDAKLELSQFKDPLNVNNIISNKVLSDSFNYVINEQLTLDQSKWNVMHFLMQLKLLYGDNFINQSVNQIKWTKETTSSDTILPTGGYVSVLSNPYISCIELFSDVFNREAIKELYSRDQITANGDIYILVHEYGHILSIYAGLNEYQKNTINKHKTVNQCNPITGEEIKIINFNKNASNRLAQWIEQRFSVQEKLTKEILLSLMAPSSYGRLMLDDLYISKNAVFMEWFGEVFAYWMLTVKQNYSVRWQIVNDFFIDVLPKFL